MIMDTQTPLRPIRSFVRREGRLTPAQQRAFEQLWSKFGIELAPVNHLSENFLSVSQVFNRDAPCILEIGFGNGESLVQTAQNQPEHNYLGIEVHRPGVGHLLLRLDELAITNVRIICADAVDVLKFYLKDASLDRIQIFFPDPWPKKRHHKRRLIQTEFVGLLAAKLKPQGILHLATDWQDYALQMLEILQASHQDFQNTTIDFAPRPSERPETKFERRGQRLGHQVWDLIFQRC